LQRKNAPWPKHFKYRARCINPNELRYTAELSREITLGTSSSGLGIVYRTSTAWIQHLQSISPAINTHKNYCHSGTSRAFVKRFLQRIIQLQKVFHGSNSPAPLLTKNKSSEVE